ncbi:TPA: DUF3800 domain-containing protein [Patescibacteria group bacterium]|nr:DUF3800 domain-containing protein [Candidatus Gracilibacteria bacterium]
MSNAYNIYCDESCHLEKDGQKVMVLGAVWCSADKVKEISQRINEIKIRNGMTKQFEIKWTKVSPGGLQLYTDIVNYFFDDDDLHFRAVVADKTILDHQAHSQTHDEWYYKMYYQLLKSIVSPEKQYNIYLDFKDTLGVAKVNKLQKVLSNSKLDFDRQIFQHFQEVRSHESILIQLSDLLIGSISFKARNLNKSPGKKALVDTIKNRSGYTLNKTTLYQENKFNLFFWDGNQHG